MNFLKVLVICLMVTGFVSGCVSPRQTYPIAATKFPNSPPASPTPDPLVFYIPNLSKEYQPVLQEMKEATRYTISIRIEDSITEISGNQEVHYTNTETIPLTEVYFRLFPNVGGDYMTVTRLAVDGQPAEINMEHRNTALRVDLPQALPPGGQTLISMDFLQNVPASMGGNYGLYIYLDDILALDQFFPIIPVYDDDEGWNVEDPPINADMLFADAAFFEVHVDAPQELVLAGSGIEISAAVQQGRQQVAFAGGPQRDFFLAASARFASASADLGETRVNSYFPEEYRESGEMVLQTALAALRSFNQRFGLYPYTELDLISTPMIALGMEYSAATTLSLDYYDPQRTLGAFPSPLYLESAAAHEVGHQWFFNQVMSDQIDEPWLDEGLVQYLTYLYYVDRYGAEQAQSYIDSWYARWVRLDFEGIPIGKPAGEYTFEEYSPIVYGRAPLFFLTLKEELGEEVFNQLLHDYTARYRWGIADTQAFKVMAEEACACDLSPLFLHWVYD